MKIQRNIYQNIHCWIRYHYGKASLCENKDCKCLNIKRYEWALKKGKTYEKNIDNFKQLCSSCHKNYDMTDEIRANVKKASFQAKKTKCPKGHLYSKENTVNTKKNGWHMRLCRICQNKLKKRWRESNKEHTAQYKKDNREHINMYNRNYKRAIRNKKLEDKINLIKNK